MNENIHVMADESLGGVMREYREVARKATAGEYVRVFGHGVMRGNGTFKVDTVSNGRIDYTVGGDSSFGTPYYGGRAYVTLEATDIIVVADERLRMVNRGAKVGERIVVTKPYSDEPELLGKFGECTRVSQFSDNSIDSTVYEGDGFIDVEQASYAVLEPLTAASIESTYELRIQALEKRVAELERSAKVVRVKSPQELRDEIVEFAKKDVLDLLSQNYPSNRVWFVNKRPFVRSHVCSFVVDIKKRTTVALISTLSNRVDKRGIAKCAPDDVFDANIGQAIALRRALGLAIPLEYTQESEVNALAEAS